MFQREREREREREKRNEMKEERPISQQFPFIISLAETSFYIFNFDYFLTTHTIHYLIACLHTCEAFVCPHKCYRHADPDYEIGNQKWINVQS